MEWFEAERGFPCLCNCPRNHRTPVCGDSNVTTTRQGRKICEDCATIMRLLPLTLDQIQHELVRILFSRTI
jgi:hypothetical protein